MLVLAVLEKRLGVSFARRDVYVNVIGGGSLTYKEKAAGGANSIDLAVAVAMVSSLTGIPVREDTAFVGEIGLTGEMRPVGGVDKRVAEAQRMGFTRVIVPQRLGRSGNKFNKNKSNDQGKVGEIVVIECRALIDAINEGLVMELPKSEKSVRRGVAAGGMNRKDLAKRRSESRSATPGVKPWKSLDEGMLNDLGVGIGMGMGEVVDDDEDYDEAADIDDDGEEEEDDDED